jgi:hypothetical protein
VGWRGVWSIWSNTTAHGTVAGMPRISLFTKLPMRTHGKTHTAASMVASTSSKKLSFLLRA